MFYRPGKHYFIAMLIAITMTLFTSLTSSDAYVQVSVPVYKTSTASGGTFVVNPNLPADFSTTGTASFYVNVYIDSKTYGYPPAWGLFISYDGGSTWTLLSGSNMPDSPYPVVTGNNLTNYNETLLFNRSFGGPYIPPITNPSQFRVGWSWSGLSGGSVSITRMELYFPNVPPPTINSITCPSTVIQGPQVQQVQCSASVTGISSYLKYQWTTSPDGTVTNDTTPNPIFQWPTTGTKTVTLKVYYVDSSIQSDLQTTQSVTVNVVPPITIDSVTCPSTLYQGQNGQCSVSASAGSGGTLGYSWTVSPDGTVTNGTTTNPTVNWLTTGTKTVTVKVYLASNPSVYKTQSVTVNIADSTPTVNITCPPALHIYESGVCNVTASVPYGQLGYTYTSPTQGATITPSADGLSATVKFASGGTGTVNVTAYRTDAPNVKKSASADITLDSVNITLSDIVCSGDLNPSTAFYAGRTIQCQVTATPDYGTASISFHSVVSGETIQSGDTAVGSFVFLSPGTVKITATATHNEIPGISVSKDTTITILDSTPTVSITCPQSVWKGQQGTCVAVATSPWGDNVDWTYNWIMSRGQIVSKQDNTAIFTSDMVGTSNIAVTAMVANQSRFQATANANVQINGIDTPKISYKAPTKILRTETTTFTAEGTSTSGPVALKWILWDGTEVTGDTLNVAFMESKQYSFTLQGVVVGHEGDPDAIATKIITVYVSAGAKPILTVDAPYNVARDDTVTLSAHATPPAGTDYTGKTIRIKWTLPDGSEVLDQETVSYKFTDTGLATVTVSAWFDGFGLPGGTSTITRSVKVYEYYFPDFKLISYIKGTVYAPYFTYFGVLPLQPLPYGSKFKFDWDFGDGETFSSDVPKLALHTFINPGTYTVTLKVTDKNGQVKTDSVTFTLVEPPPINVDFKFISTNKFNRVPFVAIIRPLISGGNPQTDKIIKYEWIVNGVPYSSAGGLILKVTDVGTYDIRVNITTKSGKTASGQYSFVANPNTPPTCDFTYKDYPAYKYTKFFPYCSDPDGRIVSYEWDFGNGNKAYTVNPYEAYATGGDYTVTLTVKDDSGAPATVTKTVTVQR